MDWRAFELRGIADREQRRVDTLRRMADNLDAGRLVADGIGVRSGAAQEAVPHAGLADGGLSFARAAAHAEHGSGNEPSRHGDFLEGLQ